MTGGIIALCVIGSALLGSVDRGAQDFSAAQKVEEWAFHNGAEFPGAAGEIAWNAKEGHAGPGCLELRYSFAGGGNYVQAMGPVPAGVDAKVARLWIKKASGHRITFRATDSAGQTFQKSLQYSWPEWQQVEVDLTRWTGNWGGPKDGIVRPPMKQFGILVENSEPARQGVLLVDDLEFAAEPSAAAEPTTYAAASYVKPVPTVSADFSLLGEPVSMKIVVDSDGSGRDVRVELGSHFQMFDKHVGKLTVKGEQVIEFPLGKLGDWRHYGGENNGVARLPLRLRRIEAVGAGGPKAGTFGIKRVEVTTLPRDGQLVVLVPDVREEGGQLRFKVRAVNLRDKQVKGKLLCDVRSLTETMSRHESEQTLGANGGEFEWTVAAALGDNGFVEAVFQWMDDTFTSKPVSIGTCAMPKNAGSSELVPSSIAGAGLYLYRHRWNPKYRESLDQVCDLAQRAGVKWTREEIQWGTTEPSEGKFDWEFYDAVVDTARAHGISVYGLLAYWSGWAEVNTPKGVEQYCRWARQVVCHYKGKIKYWEIWNEPNIFFWSGPKELYADLLKQAYDAIKAEDPEAVVLGCSTAGIDTRFIKNVMEWGGKFDALTIHPYRGVMNDLDFIKELQDVRRLVDGREVWLTEIGFPSQLIDGWSERRQASMVARVYLCTAASRAGRNVSWYDFRNDGNDPFYNEMNFGLVRQDLRLKPGYGTLAAVNRVIGDMRPGGSMNVGTDAYAYRFSDGKRRDVVAVCSPQAGRLLTVRSGADSWLDAFGKPIKPLQSGGTATVTLDAGFPVYVEGPADFQFDVVANPVSYRIEPSGARAGESFVLKLDTRHQVGDVSWDLPQGWRVEKSGDAAWRISVPENAPAYDFDIQAVLRLDGGAMLRLPVRVSVTPSLLRS
jgi:hypothetical protein